MAFGSDIRALCLIYHSWGCSYYFFLDDEFEGSGDLSDPLPVYELVFRL